MSNLEQQGRPRKPRVGVEASRINNLASSKLVRLFAAMTAVVTLSFGCSNPLKECLGDSQGEADKKMLKKYEKQCRIRMKMLRNRDEGDNKEELMHEAETPCKLLNNKSFDVEKRIRRALKSAALEEDEDKIGSCRIAKTLVRKKGDKGADAVTEIEEMQ